MSASFQVRRATVEDVPGLRSLWEAERLPAADLEKRFKEFQVVTSDTGDLLGAIGVVVTAHEGCLHGEVFAHPEQSDALREQLWGRIQSIAANHGLVRLWTQLASPFWRGNGFQSAAGETLTKLPPTFGDATRPWHFLQLKEEVARLSVDQEFELFKEAEQERTQQLMRRAKSMKVLAAIISVALFVLVLVWALMFFRAQHLRPQ